MLTRSVDIGVTQDSVVESRASGGEKQVMLYGVFANAVRGDRRDGVSFINGEIDWLAVDGFRRWRRKPPFSRCIQCNTG